MCIVQRMLVQREREKKGERAVAGWEGRGRGGAREGLRKADSKGDRQTDRMEEIEKGSWQTVGEQSLGKDITGKWRNGREREHHIR